MSIGNGASLPFADCGFSIFSAGVSWIISRSWQEANYVFIAWFSIISKVPSFAPVFGLEGIFYLNYNITGNYAATFN